MQHPRRRSAPTLLRRSVAAGLWLFACAACAGGHANRSDAFIAGLEAAVPDVVSRGNSPSMQVAVVHQDRIIWSRGFGEDPRVDSVYMNGSVQKVFEAVAVLRLVEEGRFDLDADVGTYLPFTLRHPDHPAEPVTLRMLLSHRSGLGAARHQFSWDTAATFSPEYRPAAPSALLALPLDRFLSASLMPGGSNYDEGIWVARPDTVYHYALIGSPLMRYMIERVTGERFPDYMQRTIFDPLGMKSSGYSAEAFSGRNAVPHTRIDGSNVELPVWDGNGYMMRTSAEDQAALMIAMIGDGRAGSYQLLRPETVRLMRARTSRFKVLFKSGPDLQPYGEGLGLNVFRGGWYGFGGSTPGYQCLWRFNPSRQVGYVILSNVNAILGGGDNYASARSEIFDVQNVLLTVLDPTLEFRNRVGEASILGVIVLLGSAVFWHRRRRRRLASNRG